jgi:bleomycin hydrolase
MVNTTLALSVLSYIFLSFPVQLKTSMKQYLIFFILVFGYQQVISQTTTQNYLPLIHLTDSVICTEIKDQSSSPTCWVFGTNSLFESDILKRSGIKLNLSEMFIARYSYIDKLNKWLSTKGKTYYAGGGQFHDVLRVLKKQGMMPEKAYSGLKKGESSHNHALLDTAMKKMGNVFLKQGKTTLNVSDTKKINDTLDHYLGKLPATFWYNLKQYTPETFAKEIVFSTEDYIEVMSFADLPLNKKCLLTDKFNWAGDSLYNISLDDMQMLIDTALKKGCPLGGKEM